jgi:hypothetical protein
MVVGDITSAGLVDWRVSTSDARFKHVYVVGLIEKMRAPQMSGIPVVCPKESIVMTVWVSAP